MTPADIQHVIFQPGGYRLSEGVYATREGLRIVSDCVADFVFGPGWNVKDDGIAYGYLWSDVAKPLRYREGQPCAWIAQDRDPIYCGMKVNEEWRISCLHRFAALICDNANAFRVLYWCITELGGEDES